MGALSRLPSASRNPVETNSDLKTGSQQQFNVGSGAETNSTGFIELYLSISSFNWPCTHDLKNVWIVF